jgi:diguanylate cyclase (GGDEF)-like protein
MMATLAFFPQILIYLPPIACLVVISLIHRPKEKTDQHKMISILTFSLLVYTVTSVLQTVFTRANSVFGPINTISSVIALFILGWVIWMFGRRFFVLKEKVEREQTGLILLSLLFLLLGGGPYLVSIFVPAFREQIAFQSLNIFDLSIIVSSIIFAFTFFPTPSPDFQHVALMDIFHNLKDAVFILDPELKILQYNATAKGVFHSIQPGDEITKYLNQIGPKLEKFAEDTSNSTEFEINIKGFIYAGKFIPIQSQNELMGWNIILSDITKLKHSEEQLAHYALHDRLTELPNRVILMDRINHAMLSARRDENYKFAILNLDLDRFKAINENLGHQAGDQVLVEVANRLKQCLRKVDTAACLGGDEFVILLDKISGIRAASEVSVRILDLLSKKIELEENEIYPSASIGISMGSPRHKKPEDILGEADAALQEAKERGKGQYVIYDKEMHAHVSQLFQLESDLHNALQGNQFELHYQPILSFPEQGLLGFEALLRWDHPDHGLMLPGEFLPEADEPELILPIGYWEIERACQDLAQWTSSYKIDHPFSMSINLFRKQLVDPKLPEVLQSIFEETKVSPASLTLEIKEIVIVDDDPNILEAITRLKAIGVRLSIDDFGTGYSSLRVLPTYPIDVIKIAPMYIRNICRSPEDYEVVRFIVELGKRLGIDVIAQGIESPHEFVEVQSIACVQGQGSYFSQPLDQKAVDTLLNNLSQEKPLDQKIDHKKIL